MPGHLLATAGLLASWVPDPSPNFGADPTGFVVMTIAGFLIAVVGHIVRSKAIVALGIGLVFLAAFLLPLAVYLVKSPG